MMESVTEVDLSDAFRYLDRKQGELVTTIITTRRPDRGCPRVV